MIPACNPKGYVVRISELTLIQLCQSGLEAYSIPHSGKQRSSFLEVYLHLWGSENRLTNGKTFFSVELATVDTSARMGRDYVDPELSSLELKHELMAAYWPQYRFLGDAHTHPYDNVAEVRGDRGYDFSDEDIHSITGDPERWNNYQYRVGLVLTIAALQRAGTKQHNWLTQNTLEFTLGNYRMWLKAYVSFSIDGKVELTDHDSENVLLDCPSLVGLQGEYVPFGRVKQEAGRPRYRAEAHTKTRK